MRDERRSESARKGKNQQNANSGGYGGVPESRGQNQSKWRDGINNHDSHEEKGDDANDWESESHAFHLAASSSAPTVELTGRAYNVSSIRVWRMKAVLFALRS